MQEQVAVVISTFKRSFEKKRNYTKLTKSVDKILNVFVDKYLIELPPIVKHHFPMVFMKIIGLKNFAITIELQDT